MKQKYLLLIIILFMCLFLFSTTSLALIPGDFGSAEGPTPDGCVDFEDLMIFALAYGSTPSDSNWNEVCDIAGLGSTTPDGIIDFEDLMIFALHYGEFLVHNLTKDTYYNTIQAALDDADSGNTIEVNDGTYTENIIFPEDKAIVLKSINGKFVTTINGVGSGSVVTIVNCPNGTTLHGFTITGGNDWYGGGIYIDISSPTIQYNTISGNTASRDGGGIWISFGSPTIQHNTISGNTANWGGGISIDYSSPTIGGVDENDTANFNTICGNTPDQINPDSYPNNYIDEYCP